MGGAGRQKESDAASTDLHGLWQADLRRLALARVETAEAADEGDYRCLVGDRPRIEAAR